MDAGGYQGRELNTAEEQRDAHLRSPDFFDVASFPEIIFESTTVKVLAPDRYEVKGDLTMHGHKRSLSFILNTTNPVRGMYGELRVGGTVNSTLQRKDWGLTWNQILEFGGVVVSDEVWFSITVQAIPESTPN